VIAGNILQKSHASGYGFFAFGRLRMFAAAGGVTKPRNQGLQPPPAGRELVYTIGRYCFEGAMGTKPGSKRQSTDAKLFWNGRSQAVRLPKEFRFEGDRVRVTRMGAGILIEPLPAVEEESMEALFARMDAMGADPIFPEGRKQNLAPIREYFP
jgi:antitoxin VapB